LENINLLIKSKTEPVETLEKYAQTFCTIMEEAVKQSQTAMQVEDLPKSIKEYTNLRHNRTKDGVNQPVHIDIRVFSEREEWFGAPKQAKLSRMSEIDTR
jgi:hypothetical protein